MALDEVVCVSLVLIFGIEKELNTKYIINRSEMADTQANINLRQAHKGKVKGLGIFLFLMQVGIMFAYGFGTYFNTTTTANALGFYSDNSYQLIKFIGSAILAIIGWGLIIAYSENSALSSLTITLIVISLTVQLQPLLYAFWIYCLFGGWGTFAIDLISMETSMFASISLMVAFCYLSGRVSIIETFIVIIVFNFGWALNSNLLTYLFTRRWTNQIQVVDANGTNYIYLFGCVFALIVSIMLNFKPGVNPSQNGPRYAVYVGLIGTGFAFAAFPFSRLDYYALTNGAISVVNTVAIYEHPMNIYFTLSASVMFTYWASALFAGFKVGVRESLVGVLGGGAMISVVSPYINNIGGCIAVGAFAGIISGLWLRHGYPRMNQNKPYDPLGLTGPILLNAFFGAFVVAPILMAAYRNNDLIPGQMSGASSTRHATYYLAIFGVTLGIAIGFGLLAGLICSITRNPLDDFLYLKLISRDSGLYFQQVDRRPEPYVAAPVSMNNLHNQQNL